MGSTSFIDATAIIGFITATYWFRWRDPRDVVRHDGLPAERQRGGAARLRGRRRHRGAPGLEADAHVVISREACPHSPKGRFPFRATARGLFPEGGELLRCFLHNPLEEVIAEGYVDLMVKTSEFEVGGSVALV